MKTLLGSKAVQASAQREEKLLAECSSLQRTGQDLGKKRTAKQRFKNALERKKVRCCWVLHPGPDCSSWGCSGTFLHVQCLTGRGHRRVPGSGGPGVCAALGRNHCCED